MLDRSLQSIRSFSRHLTPGDATLWFLAAFHTLVLLSFILIAASLTPANASETSCTGRNLLLELKQADPALLAEAETEASAIPNGRGIFWKVEKDGVEPSYLLGTMHVTDPRVLRKPTGAREAAAAADVIVIESDEILDERKAAAALLMHPELTMFSGGERINDFLSEEQVGILEEGLKERGLSLLAVSRMKPWLIASFVALPACELERKANGASFLDKQIAEDALKAGKEVAGLETLVEQLQAMAALPLEFHFQALLETIALGEKMDDVMETMTELYLAGEIGMTMPMLRAVTKEYASGDDNGYAAFEKRIITDRNILMAERSLQHLEAGNAFIAVGALHLPGEQGLVELLRQKGYKVTLVGE
ncbi:TraB/GumN family protein [Peteryoungia desertarenae]|uniref:TraB/GumN family protein n=1 Tax=Peteryoungia desertarenae TaxID=1813451 RepID=A0ABX6QJB3_9HYPH|nr:TraB/GumN family protein [Peteryoungia desertarenae]QLF68653.1 TraB/GumN family protein [Peteryoungia desertarenae]